MSLTKFIVVKNCPLRKKSDQPHLLLNITCYCLREG